VKLHPIADRVLVDWIEVGNVTPGGILIPDMAKEKPSYAKVVSVGPGKRENGTLISPTVKEGDTVLLSKYAGTEIKVEGNLFVIVREEEIIAVVER